jgi:hypothetical protein
LDEFFKQKAWPPVDLIKLDVEGSEQVALDGMREVVSRNGDLKLIMEYNPTTLTAAHVRSEDIAGTMDSIGFSKVFVIEGDLEPYTIPGDISRLDRVAAAYGVVNLLCVQ